MKLPALVLLGYNPLLWVWEACFTWQRYDVGPEISGGYPNLFMHSSSDIS